MASTSQTQHKNDGFRQAMLKTALETIPLLSEENYSIWKDKMNSLLKMRGVHHALESKTTPLSPQDNDEIQLLLISKVDSITHNNIISAENVDSAKSIWASIKERYSSSEASNRARILNDFLHITFREDNIAGFITDVRITIKKIFNIGIDLPQDIIAYLILFKFPSLLQELKRKLMHSDKTIHVNFVCSHLTQFNNKVKAENANKSISFTDSALVTNKTKFKNQQSNQCVKGYHNPKQDKNNSERECFHLHPDNAPKWWRENQAKWKEKQKAKK